MSFGDDEDLGDLNDPELERELRELQAIKAAVQGGANAKKKEPAGGAKKKSGGKKTIEQQLLGEVGSDIDDDDLEAELNALISSEASEPRQKQPKSDGNSGSPPNMKRLSAEPVAHRSASPAKQIPQPVPTETAPPLPPRRVSDVPPVPKRDPTPQVPVQQSAVTPSAQESAGDARSQAKQLLLKRRQAYAINAKLALEDGNSAYAKECADTVLMFEQALEACEEQEITVEDLSEIPGTPPPYKKKNVVKPAPPGTQTLEQELMNRIAKFEELAAEQDQKGDAGRARMQRRLGSQLKDALKVHKRGGKIQPDLLPVPVGFTKLPPNEGAPTGNALAAPQPAAGPSRLSAPNLPQQQRTRTPSPARSEPSPQMQAEMLKAKVIEYKKAALAAKNKGDLGAAAKFLKAAKKIEQEANQLSPPKAVNTQALIVDNNAELQITASSKLLVNLKHQLEMVMKLHKQFEALKDPKQSSKVQLYNELMKSCTKDLSVCHHEVKSGRDPLVRYKINEISLPTLEVNFGMAADILELKIVSISNVKMPDGWKPEDAQTYVTFDFPIPNKEHQTGKTQIVYKTNNPEFNESFQLKIDRRLKSLQRISQRAPIKLAIYQKGGFLRSDKPCGEADILFGDINNQATVHVEQEVLEHRKKTGAMITVEIRVQKPLDEKKMNTVRTYPWLRLVNSN